MLLDSREHLRLGVAESRAVVSVPTPKPAPGTAFPPRRLYVNGTATFELNLWCGTCPSLAQRLSNLAALDVGTANDRLNAGLPSIDDAVLAAYSSLLPESEYTALLLEVTPQLVQAGEDADYFTHEQIDTWGVDPMDDAVENVSPYYRTFETPTGKGHLYELVVPMVPPTWNEASRVAHYAGTDEPRNLAGVSYSLLDVIAPAMEEGPDYYEHWVLTHFLLDGHHKFEAAARSGRSVRLLALIDNSISIASPDELDALIHYRSAPRQQRTESSR